MWRWRLSTAIVDRGCSCGLVFAKLAMQFTENGSTAKRRSRRAFPRLGGQPTAIEGERVRSKRTTTWQLSSFW
jgi:hypothetical protein